MSSSTGVGTMGGTCSLGMGGGQGRWAGQLGVSRRDSFKWLSNVHRFLSAQRRNPRRPINILCSSKNLDQSSLFLVFGRVDDVRQCAEVHAAPRPWSPPPWFKQNWRF